MAISKRLRQRVYEKCGGRCGYCGQHLTPKTMQVDHMMPLCSPSLSARLEDGVLVHYVNDLSNLMPACRTCNHYKRSLTVEGYRHLLTQLHRKLVNMYLNKVAINFGMIQPKHFSGRFYFESIDISRPGQVVLFND